MRRIMIGLIFAVGGCSGNPASPDMARSSSPSPTGASSPSASARAVESFEASPEASAAAVEHPAPPELQGLWETVIDDTPAGGSVALTLTAGTWTIVAPPNSARGTIAVQGNEIEFESTTCDGIGRYTWMIEDDQLTFEVIREPCPQREAALDGHTYR